MLGVLSPTTDICLDDFSSLFVFVRHGLGILYRLTLFPPISRRKTNLLEAELVDCGFWFYPDA